MKEFIIKVNMKVLEKLSIRMERRTTHSYINLSYEGDWNNY